MFWRTHLHRQWVYKNIMVEYSRESGPKIDDFLNNHKAQEHSYRKINLIVYVIST